MIERPSWDDTWMLVARALAARSHDPTFKVGAIIATSDNTQVLAVGYNGNAPGLPHTRDSDEPGKSNFLHAEENCLLKLDFHHPSEKVMYVTLSPCLMCSKRILACRINHVVFGEAYRDTSGIDLLRSCGVTVRQH